MSEIGSRPYPEPWGEVQKLVAEPVWLGVNECELADFAQTLRTVADLERASGDEIHSHAGRLEDNHAGGGLDAGPEALRCDSTALHVHAERCEKTAAILDEAAQEIREAKVDLSILGAYAQSEQESWDVLLKQTANARWVQKLAAKSLEKAQAAAKARADKAETFFTAKIREHDKLHEEEIVVGHVDLDEVDGPSARNAAAEPQPASPVRPAETEWRGAADASAFEHHENAWPAQPESQAPAPSGTPDSGHRADQPERPEHSWPPPPEDHPSGDPAATTSAQSGSAVLEHDTSPASTEAQAADLAVPDDVTNIDLQESSDAATMGAAGSMTGQALNLANVEEQYRAGGAHGYHGDDGFFGDRRAEELPQDHKSVLARWAKWLGAQPDVFPARGLAPTGEPKYLLSRHLDSEGLDRTFVYSNLGPGVLGKRLPVRAWPGWEHAADPVVHVALLGGDDLVHGARRHFEQQRDLFAAHGLTYSLVGMAVTYPATEYARRAIQDTNGHLTGAEAVEAPFLVAAAGPLVEPEGGSAHPLQYFTPDLYNRITELLAGPWAVEARARALDWVADIVEGSGAQSWEGFTAVRQEIKDRRTVSQRAYLAACEDGAQLGAQTWRNLAQVQALPEAQRSPIHFQGFLAYHRALIALAGLERWGQAQLAQDPGFVHDLAYLAIRAKEADGDRDLPVRMIAQLPDPAQSYWKAR
ncbi:MAG: hypothetical protein ACRC20_06315 [Segniliparus sp.]|uniref:hypothetical protein n=1 Tax=Segniliparus sp. TaxID=2804064 RepID=UPI003F3FD9BD